jgi:hypothetical protein
VKTRGLGRGEGQQHDGARRRHVLDKCLEARMFPAVRACCKAGLRAGHSNVSDSLTCHIPLIAGHKEHWSRHRVSCKALSMHVALFSLFAPCGQRGSMRQRLWTGWMTGRGVLLCCGRWTNLGNSCCIILLACSESKLVTERMWSDGPTRRTVATCHPQ